MVHPTPPTSRLMIPPTGMIGELTAMIGEGLITQMA